MDKKTNESYERIAKVLLGKKEFNRNGVPEIVREFWEVLCQEISIEDVDAYTKLLMEELVSQRIVEGRIMASLGENGVMLEGLSSTQKGLPVPNPAVDMLAKTQERVRKIMKELVEKVKKDETGSGLCLSELLAPILEKGEGVLEDAMEFEARKKSAKKKKSRRGGHKRVADGA